jgi:hypothetical protein
MKVGLTYKERGASFDHLEQIRVDRTPTFGNFDDSGGKIMTAAMFGECCHAHDARGNFVCHTAGKYPV